MAPRLVKAGSPVASLAPAFGQATTAGNLLVAFMFSNGGNATDPFTSSSGGWIKLKTVGAAFHWTSFWYKPGCGASETAPTFTDAGGGPDESMLAEFSGVVPSSPVDSEGDTATSGGTTATNAASDHAGTELFVALNGFNSPSGSPTWTLTMADSNGTSITPVVTLGTGGNGSNTLFYATYGITGPSTGSNKDTATINPSVFQGGGDMIVASWLSLTSGPTANRFMPQGVAIAPFFAGVRS